MLKRPVALRGTMSEGLSVRKLAPWAAAWALGLVLYAWLTNTAYTDAWGTGSWTHIWVVFGSGVLWAVLLLGIHDLIQPDEPIQRQFPVAIWGRRIAYALGPLLRQYWFAQDLEEKPFDRITRRWVHATSRGQRNTIGFGSQTDFDATGAYHVLPATFTNMHTHPGEETGKDYERVIGEHTGVAHPVRLNHFVWINAMSYGALSERAHRALNLGAKQAGILHNVGEGGLAPCHEETDGPIIFQIGTGKYGVRDDAGELDDEALAQIGARDQVRMFEVKLAQGAKPGKGGMLLKEKITPEIARIRGIPMGQDCHSPPRHAEFSDVDGLFDFVDHVRGIVDKPVGIKMVIGHTAEIEAIARKMSEEETRGPDFIMIDGSEGGTGAAPLVLASNAGLPMRQAVAVADWALKRHGVRDRVVLASSGRIATPIDVAVAMALGADVVGIARGFLLALGCIQALECHTNICPTGIATQSKWRQHALDVEAAADRVAQYVKTLEKEVRMLAESTGHASPDRILPDDIMVVTSPGHLDYLSELHGISAYEASLEREEAHAKGLTVGELKMQRAEAAG